MAWWSIRFGSESFIGSHGTRSGGRSLNHHSRADMIQLAIGGGGGGGGMVAREMLFEVQECFCMGSSASFTGTAENVVDILLDKVSYAYREEKDDPLHNVSLFCDSFEFLIGKRNEKSTEARAGQIIHRIQVLENVKRHGVILANDCLVPIYSGIGNTVMWINQSMGLPYKDRGIKFKGNSKQQIIKAVWASYGVELVKHYKPRHLVILGKGVHEAIGQDELELVMQGMGGKYLGYIKHPSWNGHYGYNIMPLLCKL